MDYHCDSRAHDSGYFTPSPDKDNINNSNNSKNNNNNNNKIVR
jgi:hypothetical protein